MRLHVAVFNVSWVLALLTELDYTMPDRMLPVWAYPVLLLALLGCMLYSGIKSAILK